MTIKIKLLAHLFSIIAGIGWANVVCGQTAKQAKEIASAIGTAQTNIKSYLVNRIERDPNVAGLAVNMPLRPWEDIPFEMIANTRMPSDVDRRGILAYAKIYESYQKDLQDLYGMSKDFPGSSGSFFSGLGSITKNAGAHTLNNLAQLYNGQISFGEYSQRQRTVQINIEDSTRRLVSAIESANEMQRAERERQWRAEQQAQRVEQERMQQRQENYYERNRTKTTICNRLGEFLFCSNL